MSENYKGNNEFCGGIEMAFSETYLAMQRLKEKYGEHAPESATAKIQLNAEFSIEFVIPMESVSLPQSAQGQSTA